MFYSFDIFDTIITRITYDPSGIFEIIQQIICQHPQKYQFKGDVSTNFTKVRQMAEINARRLKKGQEVTLEDIYLFFLMMTGIDCEDILMLKELEIYVESVCIRKIDKNFSVLKELLEQSCRVVLISDMYLPENILRPILIELDPLFADIPIYISCDYDATKASGMLYAKVKEQEQVEYSEWVHYGDNLHSDVNIPKMLGIDARFVSAGTDSECEIYLNKKRRVEKDATLQLMLGLPKMYNSHSFRGEAFETGLTFAGSLFLGYIKWIVDICLVKKIDCLCFVARDGYILKKVADIYIETMKYDIKTKYVYGSRKAWRVDTEVERQQIKAYLLQELAECKKYAFVDLQGTGLSMEYVADILKTNVEVFYFILVKGTESTNSNKYVYADSSAVSIEAFCRAPHGATAGYKMEDGKWVPILEEYQVNPEWIYQYNEYVLGIELFTREISSICKCLEIESDFREYTKVLLDFLNSNSCRNIAEFIGSTLHGEVNKVEKEFAPIIKKDDVAEYVNNPRLYRGACLHYSLLRSGEIVQRLYEECKKEQEHDAYKKITGERKTEKINVIIYGAGKRGKRILTDLSKRTDVNIVAWCDANYEKYQKDELPVLSLRKVMKEAYEYVIIGILGDNEVLKVFLQEVGIPKNKILTEEEFLSRLD